MKHLYLSVETKYDSSLRIMRSTSIFLVLLIILLEVLSMIYGYKNNVFDIEPYQFIEGAKELAANGISRLAFWPNSTAALDIFMWHHFLPPHIYFFVDQFVSIETPHLAIFDFIEFLLLTLVIFLLAKKIVFKPYIIVFVSIMFCDGIFYFLFIGDYIYRWVLISGYISIILFIKLVEDNDDERIILPYAAGFFAAMSIFSFASIGVPLFTGIAVTFVMEIFIEYRNKKKCLKMISYFFLGSLTPVVLVILCLIANFNINGFLMLLDTIGGYGDFLSKVTIFSYIRSIGFFFSSLLIPHFGKHSLLPLGIFALSINLLHWKEINENEHFWVRITLVFTLVWFFCVVFISTHFFAERMIWMLPFYLQQIVIFLIHRGFGIRWSFLFLTFFLVLFTFQNGYGFLGKPLIPYGVGIAAFLTLVITAILYSWFRSLQDRKIKKRIDFLLCNQRVIVVMILIFFAPLFKNIIYSFHDFYNNRDALLRATPLMDTLSSKILEISKSELKSNDRVLTNMPVRSFFEYGVKRQLIYFYRGLFGGSTQAPADKVFLFGVQDTDVIAPNYKNVNVGKKIYYRGFIYEITKLINLPENFKLLIGEPNSSEELDDIVYPKDYIERKRVVEYLNWRKSQAMTLH